MSFSKVHRTIIVRLRGMDIIALACPHFSEKRSESDGLSDEMKNVTTVSNQI